MFDRYIAQTRPSWRRRALVIASIALHGVAGVVLVIWSFFHVDEIAPPALSLTFFSAAPPPPPPPPPPPKASSTTPKTEKPKIEKPKEVLQPTDVKPIVQPKEKEPEPEKEEDDGEEGGEEGGQKGGVVGGQKGGVQGGVIGGVVGGTVGGTGTGSAGGPPPAQPKMVASFTLIRDQISHPDPKLPDWFKNQNAGKTVVGMYKVCLRADGRVDYVIPMTTIPGVDQIIIDQVKSGWTYKPQPVPVCFPAQIKFLIR